MTWPSIALLYFAGLAALAWARPRFAAARPAATAAVVAAALIGWAAGSDVWPAGPWWMQAVLPVPVLLLGYVVSGRFYLAPMPRAEAWLEAVDRRLLVDTGVLAAYRRAGVQWRAPLELAYLLVHPMIPAGALVVARAGAPADVDRFWSVVLLAGLGSYAVLPWIQTRPPRRLEPDEPDAGPLRWLNLVILRRASTGVNTVPSGHTACAVAVWLAVAAAVPAAAPAFLALALGISVAAVLGRYHFTVDVLLGIAVAVLVSRVA